MGKQSAQLSRRERQIMDVIYERGQAAAAQVHQALPDPPSYSAVRALLRILEDKGHLTHTTDGPRYVYAPVESPCKAGRSALRRVLDTFYAGSPEQALAALLDVSDADLSENDLKRMSALIERVRKEGR